ncbi:MAG: hypothetical protein LLF92_04050 [Planctomycetaceae bacterium]|nr:hypothetical protein [Planctomycetaceae bacterium]
MDFVANDELLARYILHSNRVRADRTVKPDAFIPPDNLELSVTRHINFTEDDIWNAGKEVARCSSRRLYGRADVKTEHLKNNNLDVKPHPIENNPNHANIIGWPLEKNARKMIALEIANAARFIATPEV